MYVRQCQITLLSKPWFTKNHMKVDEGEADRPNEDRPLGGAPLSGQLDQQCRRGQMQNV